MISMPRKQVASRAVAWAVAVVSSDTLSRYHSSLSLTLKDE